MNLIESRLKLNVKTIDGVGLENVVLQTALRYGIPFTRSIINNMLDVLAEEEKLANVSSEKIE